MRACVRACVCVCGLSAIDLEHESQALSYRQWDNGGIQSMYTGCYKYYLSSRGKNAGGGGGGGRDRRHTHTHTYTDIKIRR